MSTMTWNIEVTDTFGGEANYSWVDRYKMTIADNKSNLACARQIKKVSGFNGVAGESYWYGDMYTFKPYNMNIVLFALLSEQ